MTEFLSWRDDWSNGIDWVDRDHQEMARRLNRLAEASRCLVGDPQGGPGVPCRERVLACLDALVEHTRRHFETEESFLRQIGFPGYAEHHREHVMQLAEFSDLRRELAQDRAGKLLPEALEEFKRWFFNHVIAEDRVYADFYRSQIKDKRGEP